MTKGTKGKRLVVVESPAKARTISRYLGKDYEVAASVGHVRDLPARELGVDVERGFEPKYVTIRGKGKILQELKRKANTADEVILATDPDREGEAIAYHVAEQLGYEKSPDRFRRVTFHEITREAVRRALERPGELAMEKVEAQQARRILDRLVGYQVSPFLWKPIRPGLSAGRVQTVALRLICEREDEIGAFREEEYWSVAALLEKDGQPFEAKLHQIDGKAFSLSTEEEAGRVLTDLKDRTFRVSEVKRRERRKNPFPPFTTSTLQQDAAKRLRFSARRTMTAAQRLYEGVEVGRRGSVGLITYMRTDSTRVAASAVHQARGWIEEELGKAFLASSPRLYHGKQQKGAQEAHEAIRPTDARLHPDEAREFLGRDEAELYRLIWLRFVASQMAPAIYDTTTVDFDLEGASRARYLFRATGSVVKFPGFTRLYLDTTEAGDHRRLDDLDPLPELRNRGRQRPPGAQGKPALHPAPATIQRGQPGTGAGEAGHRQAVHLRPDHLHPPGAGVRGRGEGQVHPDSPGRHGGQAPGPGLPGPLRRGLHQRHGEGPGPDRGGRGPVEGAPPGVLSALPGEAGGARHVPVTSSRKSWQRKGKTCEVCGRPMQVRWNRFGRFLGCSGYPQCQSTRPLDGEVPEDVELGVDSKTGETVTVRSGPWGPYVQLGEGSKDAKPPRASLPKEMDPTSVTLDFARIQLLALPRVIGVDPGTKKEVKAGLGKYGPYVQRERTYRNLKQFDQLFTVTWKRRSSSWPRMGVPPSSGSWESIRPPERRCSCAMAVTGPTSPTGP
jgi:DNA topoisomerase I